MVRGSVAVVVVVLSLAGCTLGPGGTAEPTATATPQDVESPTATPRPEDGTVAYGPESPGCPDHLTASDSSEFHYGKPAGEHHTVDGTPDELRHERVERFLEGNLAWAEDVTIAREKYTWIQYRGERVHVASEYGSDRYFHGRAESAGDLLVVFAEGRTDVYTFRVGYC